MKPILFNNEMVRAIQEGNKTVTRRPVKPMSCNACGFYVSFRKCDNAFEYVYDYDENEKMFDNPQTPPATVGEILYIRETWHRYNPSNCNCNPCKDTCNYPGFVYKADGIPRYDLKWKPSIHMPKEAARIFLKVLSVKVEHLQEITEPDAIKEGADTINPFYPLEGFKELWNKTIKKDLLELYGWDANPWVWVIEFEKINKEDLNNEEINN